MQPTLARLQLSSYIHPLIPTHSSTPLAYLFFRKRWQDPSYRQTYVENAKGRNHSDFTKARIAESLKLKWQDAEYRTKIMTNQKTMMSNPGRTV